VKQVCGLDIFDLLEKGDLLDEVLLVDGVLGLRFLQYFKVIGL